MNDPQWLGKPSATGYWFMDRGTNRRIHDLVHVSENAEHAFMFRGVDYWESIAVSDFPSAKWLRIPTPAEYLALVKCAEALQGIRGATKPIYSNTKAESALAELRAAREAK